MATPVISFERHKFSPPEVPCRSPHCRSKDDAIDPQRRHQEPDRDSGPTDETTYCERSRTASPFLTVPETAMLLRIPRSLVYEWTRTRAIPCYQAGKRLLFDRHEVLTWYKQTHRREGSSPVGHQMRRTTIRSKPRRNDRNPGQCEANEPATRGREAVSQLNAAAAPALVLRGR